MNQTVKHFLRDLWRPSGNMSLQADIDEDYSHQRWGLTIYRTFYGPGSDENWERLLQNMTTGAEKEVKEMEGSSEDPETTSRICQLFKPETRSDPTTLDGLTLEQVRQLYLDGTGGQPQNAHVPQWRLFILADAEVLADPDLAVLKIAAADYDPVAAVPRNTRVGPQRYFGWARMPAQCLCQLWIHLDMYFFDELIWGTPGGPGVFWDPQAEWRKPSEYPLDARLQEMALKSYMISPQ